MAKIKITSTNETTFQYGPGYYPKGDFTPMFRGAGDNLEVMIQNKATGLNISGNQNFESWRNFVDSDDEVFASSDAFAQAVAAALAGTIGVDSVASDKGTVTQATNVTTAVTLNTLSGQITTQAQTLAADAENTFTVNNSKVLAGSLVFLEPVYPAASNGVPVAHVGVVADGSFTVILTNAGTAALNAAVKINFLVLP